MVAGALLGAWLVGNGAPRTATPVVAPPEPTHATATLATGTPPPRPRSRLEAYPGFRTLDAALDLPDARRQFRAEQVVTRDCMAAKGWTYRPFVWPDESPDSPPLHEWSEVNLGQSQLPLDQQAAFTRDLVGTATTPPPGRRTLYGAGGCSNAGQDAVYSVHELAQRTDINEELAAIRLRLRADPESNRPWSACMSRAGYEFETLADLWKGWDSRPDHSAAVAHSGNVCEIWFDAGSDPLRVQLEDAFAASHRAELDEHVAKLAANAAFVAAHQD